MNSKPILPTERAFSMIDLLVLLAAILLVAILLIVSLPTITNRISGASRTNCINNLKQVGLSFRLWAGDNGDKYPMQVSTNQGGTMEFVAAGVVAPHFAVMSSELATPRILICPNQSKRVAATNFASLQDAQVSYFIVPEADETLPQLWLAGDRNLTTNGKALKAGISVATTNAVFGWTSENHNNQGYLAFADASVQPFSSVGLAQSATNIFSAYFTSTANTTFRILLP
jgi:competence protein ComGC